MARVLLDTDILSEIIKKRDADVMIAAVALPVVTGNTSHFLAIRDAGHLLQVQNWRAGTSG